MIINTKNKIISWFISNSLGRILNSLRRLRGKKSKSGISIEKERIRKKVKVLEEFLGAPIGHLVFKATSGKEYKDTRIDYMVLKRVVSFIIQKKGTIEQLTQSEIDEIKNTVNQVVFSEMDVNIDSIVMIVDTQNLIKINEEEYCLKAPELKNRSLPDGLQLSSENRFLNQRSAKCLGTGFFVDEDIIATAAHVIEDYLTKMDTHVRFIRNLSKLDDQQLTEEGIIIKKEDIFKPVQETIPQSCYDCSETQSDWAIVKVISETGKTSPIHTVLEPTPVEEGRFLYCLGHGLGLPTKVSCTGKVIKERPDRDCYDTDLIIFSGNSGSPVFDAKSHKVVGILARGTKEMVKVGDEILFQKIGNPDEGEECQKLKPVIDALKMLKEDNYNSTTLINSPQMIFVQELAPYTYCRFIENEAVKTYELYILVPVPEGKGVLFVEPVKHHSSTRIKCLVTDQAENIIKIGDQHFAKKRYVFSPDEWDDEVDLDQMEVNIRVINSQEGRSINVTMFLGDCDHNDRPFISNESDLALNCPYAFLSNPNVETNDEYRPHLILPVLGYEYINDMEQVHLTDSKTGVCSSLIVLRRSTNENLHLVTPGKINSTEFLDEEEVDGAFQAIIYLAEDLTDAEAIIHYMDNDLDGFGDNLKEKDEEKNKTSSVKIRTRDAGGTPLKVFTD